MEWEVNKLGIPYPVHKKRKKALKHWHEKQKYRLMRKKETPIINKLEDLPPGNWMPISAALQWIDISRSSVSRLIYTGKIQSFKLQRGDILVNIEEVQKILDEKQQKGGNSGT